MNKKAHSKEENSHSKVNEPGSIAFNLSKHWFSIILTVFGGVAVLLLFQVIMLPSGMNSQIDDLDKRLNRLEAQFELFTKLQNFKVIERNKKHIEEIRISWGREFL